MQHVNVLFCYYIVAINVVLLSLLDILRSYLDTVKESVTKPATENGFITFTIACFAT